MLIYTNVPRTCWNWKQNYIFESEKGSDYCDSVAPTTLRCFTGLLFTRGILHVVTLNLLAGCKPICSYEIRFFFVLVLVRIDIIYMYFMFDTCGNHGFFISHSRWWFSVVIWPLRVIILSFQISFVHRVLVIVSDQIVSDPFKSTSIVWTLYDRIDLICRFLFCLWLFFVLLWSSLCFANLYYETVCFRRRSDFVPSFVISFRLAELHYRIPKLRIQINTILF